MSAKFRRRSSPEAIMPLAPIRGIEINYRLFGTEGAWIALSPGARHPYNDFVAIAERFASAGYRVLLHDRRNCGASDVAFDGEGSEGEIWADDLHALLEYFGALPAFIGGSSAGCRLSIIFALRHPAATRALLLWRITGGASAAKELAETYYGQYASLAAKGDMQAVCDSEHFRDRIKERPSNRQRLLELDPRVFVATMTRWRDDFLRGADMPIIGASEDALRSIAQPACLIPGNDLIHNPVAAEKLHRLLPHSELREVVEKRSASDLLPEWSKAEWDAREADVAHIFIDFLKRLEQDHAR
jgi:pimeloyl-ACP methyl ester carboxylesterase